MMNKQILIVLGCLLAPAAAFLASGNTNFVQKAFISTTSTSLNIGPLQKLTNKKEYEATVNNLMKTKGYTREQAEKEYNQFLENPNNYALEKGEAYYKSLGYKTLMEGVIGEAEKEGKGDEVKQRIEEFQKQSKLKGLATISFFIILAFWFKITYVPDPVVGGM
eukprot:CAMPEP_0198116280 /NCGR_PEP_ID=MMETSP1442-20131203/10950_1 /TAXON_ID= /ORGANISM="Craspedostauros australis, Strain CCMP3328" /LENGTH=163 /DNA_ID=CAMNT_0043774057 /DNA_START=107 /DNA_END=598 /DNA_ORIENTATION=-